MANLTIAIDSDLLRRARIRAAKEGTSVNAVLRDHLRTWASEGEDRKHALEALLKLSRAAKSSSEGRRWTRDELHER